MFNVNHREKPCLTQFSKKNYWNRSLAASDLFHMFTQSINFHIFHCHSRLVFCWFFYIRRNLPFADGRNATTLVYCHISNSADVWEGWFFKEPENEQVLFPPSLTGKLELVFVLTQESTFSQKIHLKINRKLLRFLGSCVFLKNGTRDFKSSPPFDRSACFYVKIAANFELFQYFNFEKNFKKKKNENPFQKTGVQFFSWKY